METLLDPTGENASNILKIVKNLWDGVIVTYYIIEASNCGLGHFFEPSDSWISDVTVRGFDRFWKTHHNQRAVLKWWQEPPSGDEQTFRPRVA